MRVEPYTVGSYLHVVKRGARGMLIAEDEFDRQRFLRSLFYMNDEFLDDNWSRLSLCEDFDRASTWPPRKPIVSIVGFTLMPNHMHLILQETHAGGVSAFMRKLGQSMTNHYNEKYEQSGSLFQGSYRSRTIETDAYLRYVSAYVMVKNVFELYPKGGLRSASKHFDKAWEWAIRYPYSSLRHYAGDKLSFIANNVLDDIYRTPAEYKRFAEEVIEGGLWLSSEFE